jgi:hypothetical protein
VDVWLERGVEICQDHGGEVVTKTGSGGDALKSSRSGAQGNWREQFRYLPRLMHTRAAMGVVSFTFETAYTWDKFEAVDTEIIRRVSEAQKALTGGGIVCRRFSFLYPDGRRPIIPSLRLPRTRRALNITRRFPTWLLMRYRSLARQSRTTMRSDAASVRGTTRKWTRFSGICWLAQRMLLIQIGL